MEVFDEYALDELIHQYMDDEIDFDEIVEFCDNLEPSLKNKKMLMDSIDGYDIEILYVKLNMLRSGKLGVIFFLSEQDGTQKL